MTHIPAPYQPPWNYKLIKPEGVSMEGHADLPRGLMRLCPTLPIPEGYEEVLTCYGKPVHDEKGRLEGPFCMLKRWRKA